MARTEKAEAQWRAVILAAARADEEAERRAAFARIQAKAATSPAGSDVIRSGDPRWRENTQVMIRPSRTVDSPLMTPNAALRVRRPGVGT